MDQVYLSLGSNLGDRAQHLAAALSALDTTPQVRVRQVSACYNTAPVGRTNQPDFLNLAAEIETDLAPLELLAVVKGLERRLGRGNGARWGPRVIDIDLVLWAGRVVRDPGLTIPHAGFRQRAFVLQPLADIAPGAVDPETGNRVAELLAALPAQSGVTPWDGGVIYEPTPRE